MENETNNNMVTEYTTSYDNETCIEDLVNAARAAAYAFQVLAEREGTDLGEEDFLTGLSYLLWEKIDAYEKTLERS